MRPDRDHGGRRGQSGPCGDRPAEGCRRPRPARPAAGTGRPGSPGPSNSSCRPGPGPGVQQPGGRGVGDLRPPLAGQPVGQQVGQQHGLPRPPPERPALLGRELVEGVEGQELQAVDRVQLGRVERRVHLVDDRLGPAVPVGDRLGQQPAVGVQQAVVDGPGVDAEADHLRIALGQRRAARPAPARRDRSGPSAGDRRPPLPRWGTGAPRRAAAHRRPTARRPPGRWRRRCRWPRTPTCQRRAVAADADSRESEAVTAGTPRRRRRRPGCAGRWCG